MNNLMPTGRFVMPEMVITHFHLKPGDKVADFGAGGGYFLKVLSTAVGQQGKVFACEIQKQLVDKLGDLARAQGLHNIDPIWCDLEEVGGIRIPDGTLDAGVLINTLFQLEDKNAAIGEINRTMRSGANLFVIDWTESFGGLGPHPDQVFDESAAKALLESHGFIFERSFDAGDHHYGAAFRKL